MFYRIKFYSMSRTDDQVVLSEEDADLYEKARSNDDDKASAQLLEQAPKDPLNSPRKKCVQPGGLKVIIMGSIVFALAVTIALIFDIYTGEHNVGHGAVSTDAQLCADVGEDILKKGGSAVDAAIAATLCVGVVCPESSGIGGGGFMLVQSPEGEVKVIDFREVAPSKAHQDMFKEKQSSQTGGLAVAVPGTIRGLEIAHQKYGKLKWSELFAPAIKIARNGFAMLNSTEKWLNDMDIEKDLSPELKGLFKNPTNIKRYSLAKTLERISKEGSQGFYTGDVAKSIVDTVKSNNNGILTLDDLKNYTVKIREPLSTNYHNYRVFTAGLPSSGIVLLSALNILEGFNLTKVNRSDPMVYHYLVETLKFVYAQRTRLADPEFEDLENITKAMLSKQEAAKLRDRINKTRTYSEPSHYGPFFDSPPNKGTSHVTVMDRKGEIVSVTSTLNGPFGSKLLTSSGIILNNEMDDFSSPNISNYFGVRPSKLNYIKPGKRPLSSICPVIALCKKDLCGHQIVLGASGGSRITSAVIQVLFNILTYDRSLEEAIKWPRLHHQLQPMILEVEENKFQEKNMDNIVKFLKDKGNNLDTSPKMHSIVNGVLKEDGQLHGYADSRREGSGAAVY